MNAKELSSLSYKELQALAVKHKVPGNIKKHMLVKILDAAGTGNNLEVTRLLTDVKQKRKKRTKRLKVMKAEDDDSTYKLKNYSNTDVCVQQDNYSFPNQHHQASFPFQWIGAEEVVGTSKYEDARCTLSYNDVRQYVFYSTQSVYDTNNNSTLIDEIMDLRTEATVSNYRSTLDTSLIHNTNQLPQIVQQSSAECANKKMSLLLKKMLQAPVGANLGEIASPVSNCNGDSYPLREESPDNSETMTAKSDINENDEIWQDNLTSTPGLPCVFDSEQMYNGDSSYYRRNNTNALTYYRPFDNGMDQNTMICDQQQQQQEHQNQYQFNLGPQADAQENCRSWLASNTLDIVNPVVEYSGSTIARLPVPSETSIQYQSPDDTVILNTNSLDDTNIGHTNSIYCLNNEPLYSNPGSNGLLEPSEILPELAFDANRYYNDSNNSTNNNNDNIARPQDHQQQQQSDCYRQMCTPSYTQDFYEPPTPQNTQQTSQFQNYTPIYHVDLENVSYDTDYYSQQQSQQQQQQQQTEQQNNVGCTNNDQTTSCDPLQQVQDQQYENYNSATTETPVNNSNNNFVPAYGNTVLEAYWPRWTYSDQNQVSTRTSGRSLENTLNLCTANYINYSKLNETCCVYSNKTPVMTLRKGLNSATSIQDNNRITSAENRQHNFNSNCLIYTNAHGNNNSSNTSLDIFGTTNGIG